jgi:hypothetical protein
MKLNQAQNQLLQQMLDEGFIAIQKHPTANLYIYNYSAKTQYDYLWNEITLMCRGLIMNDEGEIIARPFEKFFNYREKDHELLPDEPFEVYEKLDGSLGILYWIDDLPYIATRGSFTSVQAIEATKILHDKYAHLFVRLDRNNTYLFEIIFPENRIVVNYDELRDLILISIRNISTGQDHSKSVVQLQKEQRNNEEGYVLKFASGYRVKIKFDDYVRLHRIVTQVSNIVIWEYLSEGKSITDFIEHVPDEFYNWVQITVKVLQTNYDKILQQCQNDYRELATQKDTAFYFQTCTYPSILFAMYNKKRYEPIIWKQVKPIFTKPFINNKTNDN